jgi:uncharacterized protein (TIGR02453 family)
MKTIIEFLKQLNQNNNRDWFNANKKEYQLAKNEFEAFFNRLIPEIRKFDPEIGIITAKECVFRIYRDVRFSKNKDPYKTNMGGFIALGGRKGGNAGYYIHIEPGQSFLAGGSYMPESERLKKIRQEVMYNVDEFKSLINKPSFKKTWGALEGDQLVRPPKDFPADFPDIDLLKFKSYIVSKPLSEKEVLDSNFESNTAGAFKELHPLVHFLNRAVKG